MKKHLFLLAVFLYAGIALKSQVSSISYTFSPTVQYNWWDDNSGIADGLLVGGQLGFGFGQNVELSGVYMQSLETFSSFPTYDFTNAFVSQNLERQLNIQRYGGNVKLNLSKGVLLPFLSLGTGVQKIGLDGLEDFYLSKRIYFDAGLGIKLSVADRYTLNLSAVNHYYEMNPVRELMTLEDREALNVDFNDFESERLENWGARASLIVYLGGRTPEDMTALDKAYMESFSTDYSGFSMPLEPTVGKIEFHERLPYRDTWFVGGATGFNFGPMVGLRAYYWRGMAEKGENDQISTETDDISIYGAEGRFQMAVGQGLKPYILLGGGIIDPLAGYVGRDSFTQRETTFASGGVGINIPFSKAFKLDVYGKALLTSARGEIENTTQPDDILTSYAYGASLNLVLGKKKKIEDPKPLPIPGVNGEPALILNEEGDWVEAPVNEEAGEEGANDKAEETSEDGEINGAEELKMDLAKKGSSSSSIMIMTPAEFENIIDEILDRSKGSAKMKVVEGTEVNTDGVESEADEKEAKAEKKAKEKEEKEAEELKESIEENKENIEELEDLINEGFKDLKKQIREMGKDSDERMDDVEDAIEDSEDERKEDMKDLKEDLEDVEEGLDDVEDGLEENKKALEENGNERTDEMEKTEEEKGKKGGFKLFGNKSNEVENASQKSVAESTDEYIEEKQRFKSPFANEESFGRRFSYDGMATYVGFNLGGTLSLNLGFRPTYKIDSSNLKIAPEAFFGFGSPSSFGILANVIQDIEIKQARKLINPYVGAGVGFMKIERDEEDKVRGVINLLAGAHVASVANGRLFVEYATRNFLKYNQFIAGYRLAF